MASSDDRIPDSSPDPFQGLAEAFAIVVRQVVVEALTQARTPATDTVTMVSVPEAAHRLGLGKTKVNELIACGALPSRVVGKRRLLRPADLEAFAANEDGSDRAGHS